VITAYRAERHPLGHGHYHHHADVERHTAMTRSVN
jgi:hypothetical protein